MGNGRGRAVTAVWLPLLLLSGQASLAQEASDPARLRGEIEEPKKLKHVAPTYPEDARRAGLAGNVVLECVIDRLGAVESADVVEGVPPLAEAALEAVKQWRYEPTLRNGVPVPAARTVTVRFHLNQLRSDDLVASLESDNEEIRAAAEGHLSSWLSSAEAPREDVARAVRDLELLAHGYDPSAREAAVRLLASRGEPGHTPLEPQRVAAAGAGLANAPPEVLHGPNPIYPPEALSQRIEGTVLIEALVDSQGRVTRSRVIRSVPGLDAAALAAANQWRFRPATKDGKPVAVVIQMPVAFRIY